MKSYTFLTLSIVGEVFATAMLKMSEGFTILLPSIGVTFGYGLSFYLLSLSLRTIPLSLVYAIWAGAGTALTALIGILVWNEALSTFKLSGIALIIGGIVLLNSSSKGQVTKKTSSN
ncbi:MAG TPA: multidrug efflux SMR transporter [Candidatus Avamphibacillus sp.]|nr:multidrug efflux SMR transporter [Candidatus Avamphibacillus sp.]